MTHEEHKDLLLDQFSNLLVAKYDKGAREHKSKLWEMPLPELRQNIQDEIIDHVAYFLTYMQRLQEGNYVISGVEAMTGQEWYDRWTKEFTELKRVYKYTNDVDYETIDEAAKRASGVKK